MYVEITKTLAASLIPPEFDRVELRQSELCEEEHYIIYGVLVISIYNYLSNVKQWYIQDINA